MRGDTERSFRTFTKRDERRDECLIATRRSNKAVSIGTRRSRKRLEAFKALIEAAKGAKDDRAVEAEAAEPAATAEAKAAEAKAAAAAARRMMVHFDTLDENGEPVRYNLEMWRKAVRSLETLVSTFERKMPQGVAPTLAQLQAMEMTVQYEHEGVHTPFDPSQPNAMDAMRHKAIEVN